jgi:hypothetical protein
MNTRLPQEYGFCSQWRLQHLAEAQRHGRWCKYAFERLRRNNVAIFNLSQQEIERRLAMEPIEIVREIEATSKGLR